VIHTGITAAEATAMAVRMINNFILGDEKKIL
jgi:hypothetical protein